MFKRTLVSTLVVANLAFSGLVSAEEDRSAVLERIKPIGTVSVAGSQMTITEATPAPAPAAEVATTPAPAAEPAAVVEEVVTAVEQAVAPAAADVDGKAVYSGACFACHGTGAAGAPKLGDHAAWDARVATGIDALLHSALNGKGAMPPKGGQMQLSEAEIRAAIDYMLSALN